jgi:hypothetical protein
MQPITGLNFICDKRKPLCLQFGLCYVVNVSLHQFSNDVPVFSSPADQGKRAVSTARKAEVVRKDAEAAPSHYDFAKTCRVNRYIDSARLVVDLHFGVPDIRQRLQQRIKVPYLCFDDPGDM